MKHAHPASNSVPGHANIKVNAICPVLLLVPAYPATSVVFGVYLADIDVLDSAVKRVPMGIARSVQIAGRLVWIS